MQFVFSTVAKLNVFDIVGFMKVENKLLTFN